MEGILEGFPEIYNYVYPPGTFPGPVLEIAGKFSPYVKPEDLRGFHAVFPNFDGRTDAHFLECGHNVHAEKPEETERLIAEFYQSNGLLE